MQGLPFDTVQARPTTVRDEQVFDGLVEAVKRSTVAAQTAGRIQEIYFDVDDYVEAGEVILRFRDKEQQARLEQTQAALAEAKAVYEEAQAEHARIKNLFERNLVSKSAMDKATSALESAKARVESAEARVAEAEERLEYTRVRAPYSGIVVERHVEVGETAQVGQPLMTGLSLEHLRARVDVPQTFVNTVRERGEARVLLPRGSLPAESLIVFPYADETAHTFRVRVDLPPGQNELYPGMLVKVAFTTGEAERLTVPRRAIARRSEVTAVYVVDERNRVTFRQVRVGREVVDGRVEVLAGLAAGERVALDPVRAAAYLKGQGRSDDS
ncbi:MAG: efflux RND transporter periplasmic adaptor subunit [Gammaproteobacteria bacterium]|nr:efflux RND transporter periplasmic adaptor subunit [Gammaproteobacteria bacterium]